MVVRKRCAESGALGLSLGDRRLGYRTRQSDLSEVKKRLGHSDTIAWRLSGAPLAASSTEAEAWLREMSLDGVILSHTRRIRRNCQDWIVRADASAKPKIDALALTFNSKEYLITLSRLLPRSGPPSGAKQWRGPNRWTASASDQKPSEPSKKPESSEPPPSKVREPSVERPGPAKPSAGTNEDIAALSSMVRLMYDALVGQGILGQGLPKPTSEQNRTEQMELETLSQKRPAEHQLQKEAVE